MTILLHREELPSEAHVREFIEKIKNNYGNQNKENSNANCFEFPF